MRNDQRDDESGRLTTVYRDDQFIDAVEQLDGAGTSDVADAVGCRRGTAYKRLQKLANDDTVSKNKVGGVLIWTR